MSRNIYLVSEGQATLVATPARPDMEAEADWTNSVLVATDRPAKALHLADLYDRGEIQQDNLNYHGRTIAVLTAPGRGRPRTHGGEAEARVRLSAEQRESLGRAVRASGKTIQDWMVEAIAEKIARE